MNPISVSDISRYITQIFDSEELLHGIKVYGEVSGFSIVRGNAYFSIKDEYSLLPCVLFGAEKYKNIKDGDQVVVEGGVKYYAKSGKINFYAVSIVPYGIGYLYQQFLLMKEKLQKEGLFDESHKKNLPENIKSIGVVTSSTGAVIHDIINVATRRNPMLNIFLYPAKVQGDDADLTIIDGIDFFENYNVDVIIIARGGGSLEDLMPFNSEKLARRVYECQKPIISAVGHETDFTIIDFVSDLRAPTPSAAAEIVTKDVSSTIDVVKDNLARLTYAINNICNQAEIVVVNYVNGLKPFGDKVNLLKEKVYSNIKSLKMLSDKPYVNAYNLVDKNLSILEKLNPIQILKQGYAIVEKQNGRVLKAKDVVRGEIINIGVADGNITALVENIVVNNGGSN